MSLVYNAPLFIQCTDNSICFLNHVLHSVRLPSANDPSEILYILMGKLLFSFVFSALLNNVLTVAISEKFMRSVLRDHLFKPSICSICFPSTVPFHFVYKCIAKSKVSIIINGGNKHFQKLVTAAYCNSSKDWIQFCCLTTFDPNHFKSVVYCPAILFPIRNFWIYMFRFDGAFRWDFSLRMVLEYFKVAKNKILFFSFEALV
jgi:hypothetical protein